MDTDAADAGRMPLEGFACPNSECDAVDRFAAGNRIRRPYGGHGRRRFSGRQGSLIMRAKLPVATVVRRVKCLTHGCSVEATADLCDQERGRNYVSV